mmetsp:Transcript_71779/g.199169  ORF Transcript_71779/g.199169 Transcript_71779/m.199169 type:complete len:618 (+) Transcript_71779:165-2018(+)
MSHTDGSSTTAGDVVKARFALRRLLAGLHVLDALPERSRMLAVDAELPVHSVIATVVSEQHLRPYWFDQRRGGVQPTGGPAAGGGDRWAEPRGTGQLNGVDGAMAGSMRREGGVLEDPSPLLCWGIVPPSLPSNVLAEVCEFDPVCAPGEVEEVEEKAEEKETEPTVRRWTSIDDGWGTQQPMQDLEKMPMGMPVTVGEMADFFALACSSNSPTESSQRWAQPRSQQQDSRNDGDMLDWSLAQWRSERLKMLGRKDADDPATRLFVEERPQAVVGPVLVHMVPPAPPRPILCTDDPEASLLKAVQLLLAYPELDALPIVSPLRCTVVAHLTLSYCLAYLLSRLRGPELLPLAELPVRSDGGSPQRIFDSAAAAACRESWAAGPLAGTPGAPPGPPPPPWVLGRSRPLRELLAFFARTHHSAVPIVEDGADGKNGAEGGVLGLISRRDFLQFLDLVMQSAIRRSDGCGENDGEVGSPPNNDGAKDTNDMKDGINLDANAPIEVVLKALQRCRAAAATEESAALNPMGGSQMARAENGGVGATFVYEKELKLKSLLLRLLSAENRKLLFVQDDSGNEGPPRLLRLVSVSDVWLLLIGSDLGADDAAHCGGAADSASSTR